MSTPIMTYICNLIAGRSIIGHLYDSVDRAREVKGNGGCFCYTINLKGIGKKTYRERGLLELDQKAMCTSVASIFNEAEMTGTLTVDQAVLLLLIGRNTIRGLYQARIKALFMRSTARIFCYTFKNPYGVYAGVNRDCKQYNGPQLIDQFCQCENTFFDPRLIWGGFFNV